MNVKRYIANDVQEAMQKIRLELGRDAVILHTRKIKQKGLKAWFSKPLVEVVAAVDTTETTKEVNYRKEAEQAKVKKIEQDIQTETNNKELEFLKQQMAILTDLVQSVVMKSEAPAPMVPAPIVPTAQVLQQNFQPQMVAAPIGHDVLQNDVSNASTMSSAELKYRKLLENQNITPEILNKIFSVLKRQVSLNEANEATIKSAMRVIIRDMIGGPYRLEATEGRPKVFYFVGPTGVGKTTTLAKIAAKLSLVEGKKVGLVTADTYRIAAVDQLKTYSEILSMPIEVIYEPQEVEVVIRKFHDKDYILIDTAGRNHKSPELHEDLSKLISLTPGAEVFLVISMTTGHADIQSILNSYHFIENYGFIMTKIDEAASYGNILNTRVIGNKPIAFITNGQSVPDDIAVSDADKVANWLVGE